MKELKEGIVDFNGFSKDEIKKIIANLKANGHSPEWEDTTRLSSRNPRTIAAMKKLKKSITKKESTDSFEEILNKQKIEKYMETEIQESATLIDFEGVNTKTLNATIEKLISEGHEITRPDQENNIVFANDVETISILKSLKEKFNNAEMEDIIEDITIDELIAEAKDLLELDLEESKKKKCDDDMMSDDDDDDDDDDLDDDDDDDDLDESMKLDKVGKEDGDIDNDGDEDESDKYLAKKRAAIKKAKEKNESTYKNDLKALVESDDALSEEFKEKAEIIFEAAFKERIKLEREQIQEEFDNQRIEETTKIRSYLEEKVDDYLTYAVESWVEDNKIAIEVGLRTEVAESFISALKDVFVEHYIEVPETKKDYVSDLETQINTVKEALCEKEDESKALSERVEKLSRESILQEASEDLADTQAARLKSLAEDIEFIDEESFKKKVSTIKECYFKVKPQKTVVENDTKTYSTSEIIVEDNDNENNDISTSMKQYITALGRINKANALQS